MFFDLPQGAKLDKYMVGMPTTEWHTWTNPRKEYNNAIILAAGGGGSGGVNVFGGGGGGNGGGGAGGFGHIYCPLSLLPDTLYIQVALGALGVSNGRFTGNTGGTTYISMYPSPNIANLLIACNGGGGGGAASSVVGAGGTVNIYNTFGIAQGYTGGSGGSWNIGYSTYGGSCLPTTGSPIYGGSGSSYLGGGDMLSVSSLYPTFTWPQGNRNGSVIQKPFTVFGGYGAASCCSVGWDGVMGSGGGGGGGSGEVSGKGGDGFVTIICY
jgi:hypothetical protein